MIETDPAQVELVAAIEQHDEDWNEAAPIAPEYVDSLAKTLHEQGWRKTPAPALADTRTGIDWCPDCRAEAGTNRGGDRCSTCGAVLVQTPATSEQPPTGKHFAVYHPDVSLVPQSEAAARFTQSKIPGSILLHWDGTNWRDDNGGTYGPATSEQPEPCQLDDPHPGDRVHVSGQGYGQTSTVDQWGDYHGKAHVAAGAAKVTILRPADSDATVTADDDSERGDASEQPEQLIDTRQWVMSGETIADNPDEYALQAFVRHDDLPEIITAYLAANRPATSGDVIERAARTLAASWTNALPWEERTEHARYDYRRYARALAAAGLLADGQAREDEYRGLLHNIWLHTKWRYVTGKCTTEQRELWADAIERVSERDHPGDGTVADRWWRDDSRAALTEETPDA